MATERERKQAAGAAGKARAEQLNKEADRKLAGLTSILHNGLDRNARIDLGRQLRRDQPLALDLGLRRNRGPPPRWEDYLPAEPGLMGGLLGGRARYERRLAEAQLEFSDMQRQYDQDGAERQRWVHEETQRHRGVLRKHQAAVDEHNQRIEEMKSGLTHRDRESVEAYLELALAQTPMPSTVPHQVEIAYSPRGEQAVVRFELPLVDVCPASCEVHLDWHDGRDSREEAGCRRDWPTAEACLTHLNALVSKHPHAVEPVTPVRDFDLARHSFHGEPRRDRRTRCTR